MFFVHTVRHEWLRDWGVRVVVCVCVDLALTCVDGLRVFRYDESALYTMCATPRCWKPERGPLCLCARSGLELVVFVGYVYVGSREELNFSWVRKV